MLDKLLKIASWNLFAALINFGLNFLLARELGTEFFGEFSLYNAKIALLGLIFIIIPSNYSIVKYQEDHNFRTILPSFFLLASFGFILSIFAAILIGYLSFSWYIIILYSLPILLLNFFDIIFQATNQLKVFFKLLFIIAFMKILVFLVFFKLHYIKDIQSLLLILGIVNTSILSILFIYYKEFFKKIDLLKVFDFIKSNNKIFRGYYVNSVIKRLADNAFILVFNGLLTKSQLGIFALFLKAQVFSFSLIRVMEAFLINRNNNKKYFARIESKKNILGFLLFMLTFTISLVYMRLLVGKIYIVNSLIISITAFPYVHLLLLRSKLILGYKNKGLNISMFLQLLTVLVGFILLNNNQKYIAVTSCLVLAFISVLIRVVYLKFSVNEKKS